MLTISNYFLRALMMLIAIAHFVGWLPCFVDGYFGALCDENEICCWYLLPTMQLKPKSETRRIVIGYLLTIDGLSHENRKSMDLNILTLVSKYHGGFFPYFPNTPPTTDDELEQCINAQLDRWWGGDGMDVDK